MPFRKRKNVNKKDWKRNVNRKNYHGKEFSLFTCCKDKCYEEFTEDNLYRLFQKFTKCTSKEAQDILLSGHLRHELSDASVTGRRKNTWLYFVSCEGKMDIGVCRSFIIKLYQVSEKRIRIIQGKILKGESFEERRGTHTNRPKKIDDETKRLLLEHLKIFPSSKSHYNTRTNLRYFCNPTLTIEKLYALFKVYYKEKRKEPLKMKLKTYYLYFQRTIYSMKKPKTDECDFCEELEIKLAADPGNRKLKKVKKLHLQKIKEYENIKKEIINSQDRYTIILEFDYAQNLPLPKLTVSKQFYKRLIWLYTFNVHCHSDGESFLYSFLENEGKKDANSVVSFLFDALKKKLTSDTRNVVLFSDAAGGQNKNITMVKFLAWFSKRFSLNIEHIYPVRGHSFCQCDRNFGLYSAKTKQMRTVTHFKTYLTTFVTCRKNPQPFTVTKNAELIFKWGQILDNFMRPKPSDFKIQKFVRIRYSDGDVFASRTYIPEYEEFTFLKHSAEVLNLELGEEQKAEPPGLSTAKKEDIKSLLPYIPTKNRDWIEGILNE